MNPGLGHCELRIPYELPMLFHPLFRDHHWPSTAFPPEHMHAQLFLIEASHHHLHLIYIVFGRFIGQTAEVKNANEIDQVVLPSMPLSEQRSRSRREMKDRSQLFLQLESQSPNTLWA